MKPRFSIQSFLIYSLMTIFIPLNMAGQNIDFADAEVKALCVANWDTNGDGELSMDEAAAVTSLGEVFKSNNKITSFDELQYFISLTEIESRVFSRCWRLTSIIMPNSVTSIGNYAFSSCSSLTSVTIPNSVTSIGNSAFYNCSGLTSVTIPNSVTSIGEGAFMDCSSLTSVTIPNGVTSINRSFLNNCTSLTSVTIPNSVTSIGFLAFNGCRGLISITIPNSVTKIDMYAFSGCSSLTSVIIPNSVTSIRESTFSGCSGLTSITIPNSVTWIRSRAFSGCSSLTSVSIPSSVTLIDTNSFSGCNSLNSIIVEAENKRYDSRDNCNAIIETSTNTLILGCKNTIILNSVLSIGEDAFYGCSGLESVTIPNSVTSIAANPFSHCNSLFSIKVDSENPKYDSREDCNAIIETSTNMLITGCNNTILPSTVTKIGDDAFSGCSGLTSVTIPNSVTSIGDDAFFHCSGLTSVTIPNSVTSIGNYAFTGCSGLTSVTIPNSVTSISNSAFSGCSGLTSITIPNSVTSIGNSAFRECSGLTSITIPNSVTSIGDWAFGDCSGLKSVRVGWKEPLFISTEVFFPYLYRHLVLYVPARTKDLYEAAAVWNEFKEFVEIWQEEKMLVDGQDYDNSVDDGIKKLQYSRTFKNTNWQAWYVPFELKLTNDVLERFSFAKFAGTYTEEDGSFYITVARMKEGDVVKANTPYVVQAKVADSTNPQVIKQTDVILKAAEETSFYVLSAEKKITFRGNYTHRTVTEADENWYALSGGLYSRQLPGNTIAPFRCFFTIENREDNPYPSSPNPSTVKLMVLGEDETNVENMRDNSFDNQAPIIYDLQGRKIANQTSKPGIYIMNGKKIFVK